MQPSKKKEYEKPKITKIRLDAECAVLGFCKNTGKIGPAVMNCTVGTPCDAAGS